MTRQIKWSGHIWSIKTGREGPGPNDWLDSEQNAYVDESGNLHLKIINENGTWYCTELYGAETFGYGTYIFEVEKTDKLTDNVVLGMFTYKDDENEIDIEISRWGVAADPNIGFVIQPAETKKVYDQSNHYRFYLDPNSGSINRFAWLESEVNFQSQSGDRVESWKYPSAYIPKTDKEKVHLNLWLFKGEPPINGQEQEVILKEFRFIKGRSLV